MPNFAAQEPVSKFATTVTAMGVITTACRTGELANTAFRAAISTMPIRSPGSSGNPMICFRPAHGRVPLSD